MVDVLGSCSAQTQAADRICWIRFPFPMLLCWLFRSDSFPALPRLSALLSSSHLPIIIYKNKGASREDHLIDRSIIHHQRRGWRPGWGWRWNFRRRRWRILCRIYPARSIYDCRSNSTSASASGSGTTSLLLRCLRGVRSSRAMPSSFPMSSTLSAITTPGTQAPSSTPSSPWWSAAWGSGARLVPPQLLGSPPKHHQQQQQGDDQALLRRGALQAGGTGNKH